MQDMEDTKSVLLDFVMKEKIDVYMQTPVVDVLHDDNKIKGIVTSWKTGLGIIQGEEYIDATGDGDIAYFSGVPYEMRDYSR